MKRPLNNLPQSKQKPRLAGVFLRPGSAQEKSPRQADKASALPSNAGRRTAHCTASPGIAWKSAVVSGLLGSEKAEKSGGNEDLAHSQREIAINSGCPEHKKRARQQKQAAAQPEKSELQHCAVHQ